MELFDESLPRCPHCGYEQAAEPFPFGVRPGTILRGRYLVGRVLGQGGFGITYVGYDLTLELKVAVKEYFPAGIVTGAVPGEGVTRGRMCMPCAPPFITACQAG